MIFTLERTKRTPSVELSENRLVVRGECYPENIAEFSEPIIGNVRDVLDKTEVFEVIFELLYFNSSSAMFLFDLFNMLDDAAGGGCDIAVRWRYEADDDSMEEAGADFEDAFEHASYVLEPRDEL